MPRHPHPVAHLLPSGLAPLPCMSSLRSPSTSASTCRPNQGIASQSEFERSTMQSQHPHMAARRLLAHASASWAHIGAPLGAARGGGARVGVGVLIHPIEEHLRGESFDEWQAECGVFGTTIRAFLGMRSNSTCA